MGETWYALCPLHAPLIGKPWEVYYLLPFLRQIVIPVWLFPQFPQTQSSAWVCYSSPNFPILFWLNNQLLLSLIFCEEKQFWRKISLGLGRLKESLNFGPRLSNFLRIWKSWRENWLKENTQAVVGKLRQKTSWQVLPLWTDRSQGWLNSQVWPL